MSISNRVAKRFEQIREDLIVDFLSNMGGMDEKEAIFQLSNEFGLNLYDARDMIEEYRELDTLGFVPRHLVMPIVNKYASFNL